MGFKSERRQDKVYIEEQKDENIGSGQRSYRSRPLHWPIYSRYNTLTPRSVKIPLWSSASSCGQNHSDGRVTSQLKLKTVRLTALGNNEETLINFRLKCNHKILFFEPYNRFSNFILWWKFCNLFDSYELQQSFPKFQELA